MKGAWLDAKKTLKLLLQEYLNAGALQPHPSKPHKSISFKLAVDGTMMFKGKCEGVYLSLLDIAKLQSSFHQCIVVLAQMLEKNDELNRIALESNLIFLLNVCNYMDISIGDEEYFLDYYIVMDWMGLVAELGLVNPANVHDEDVGCGFCGIQIGNLDCTNGYS